MQNPATILGDAFGRAAGQGQKSFIADQEIRSRVEFVCRNLRNRAGSRLLLACLLAKVHNAAVDVRKPYTEIGGSDAYSGRTYDEAYVGPFITQQNLPCNPTTAFLTPALRNRNIVLTPDVNLVGRPPELYQAVLQLLDDVHQGKVTASDLLCETIRLLILIRDEKQERMRSLLKELESGDKAPLSSEATVTLIEQHLKCRGASRLPVLIVAAAYRAAATNLGERMLPLEAHNAADEQTGALGDLQITLVNDDDVVTSYEMKTKRVTRSDIDRALQKIRQSQHKIDNYIFITTDVIDPEVRDYAKSMYDETDVEVVILDCLSFLRHFLHLFHRLRMEYLEAYQQFVLAEPESAVSQPLKEAFLALRHAAEAGSQD